ncbi:hypothetical protein DPMN_015679 [Dreissena polymorpha]|uniref:Uncharacterized protein n=1 Tax=Dreissena polymorpha TaxID=45954 RepID=A0A9D4N9L9_DREPO|nr:hypothetical protein DPMN_015679 [Dreissena polymorpha]
MDLLHGKQPHETPVTTRKDWFAIMNRMVTTGETMGSLERQHPRVPMLSRPKFTLREKDLLILTVDRDVERYHRGCVRAE